MKFLGINYPEGGFRLPLIMLKFPLDLVPYYKDSVTTLEDYGNGLFNSVYGERTTTFVI